MSELKTNTLRHEWLFARGDVRCAVEPGRSIEINGKTLTPDESKGYVEFSIAHSWPAITAFGTTLHPAAVSRSFTSMHHQVFNISHLMKSYGEKDEISRDHIIGSIAEVEFPAAPALGWKLTADASKAPCIRAAANLFKKAERVPKLLGEHLSGRHKWSVSLELNYNALESGFLVMNRDDARGKQRDMIEDCSKDINELNGLNLGYVPVMSAPDDLLECYSLKENRMTSAWNKLPVVLLKGGFEGRSNHFYGVGMVRYGAENEAEILRIAAGLDREGIPAEEAAGYFKQSLGESKKLVDTMLLLCVNENRKG